MEQSERVQKDAGYIGTLCESFRSPLMVAAGAGHLHSGNSSSTAFWLGLGGGETVLPDLLQQRQRLLSIHCWHSLGFNFLSGPRRSEMLLVLLPGLAVLALVVGATIFWSLFLDWLFMFNFDPLAF